MNDKNNEPIASGNAFVRFLRRVFVYEIILKLISLGVTAALWLLSVGLGSSSLGTEEGTDFFARFGQNIAVCFAEPLSVVVSVFDILLLFILVYLIVHFLVKYKATPFIVFVSLLVVGTVVLSSSLLRFPVMGMIFGNGVLLIILAIIVMYPQELRRIVLKLTSRTSRESINTEYDCTEEELRTAGNEIVKAVLNMSKDNRGAIIIMTKQSVPQHILDSGTRLNSNLSQPLIECLFNTHAGLHDGAVFIHGNKILAAGCFLPLSQSQSITKDLGTRHRAALGITEQYDVLAIVVSEETGIISVARNGRLERYYDAAMLNDVIEQVYGLKAVNDQPKKRNRRK